MLAHLARWLRAAGYDTALVPSDTPDPLILAQARAEQRILLTCDRCLAAPDVPRLHLPMAPLSELAAQLSLHLGVDWLYAPFTRCLIDNTPLIPAPPTAEPHIPQPARLLGGPFNFCPTCERVFWPGGHVRRMQARLYSLNGARDGSSPSV